MNHSRIFASSRSIDQLRSLIPYHDVELTRCINQLAPSPLVEYRIIGPVNRKNYINDFTNACDEEK